MSVGKESKTGTLLHLRNKIILIWTKKCEKKNNEMKLKKTMKQQQNHRCWPLLNERKKLVSKVIYIQKTCETDEKTMNCFIGAARKSISHTEKMSKFCFFRKKS